MARQISDPRAISRADAEQLWQNKLESIPSVFARLIYVAGLKRDGVRYEEPDFTPLVSGPMANDIIRDSHVYWFGVWLSMDLRHKTEDLEPHLKTLVPANPGEPSLSSIPKAAFGEVFRELVPADASPAESELFLGTLSIVEKLVTHHLGLK
jgi:hypothetical protein